MQIGEESAIIGYWLVILYSQFLVLSFGCLPLANLEGSHSGRVRGLGKLV